MQKEEKEGREEGRDENEAVTIREPEHLLKIFENLRQYIKEENAQKIKELSNFTIHSASIYQDTESISMAVIIYAISKIMERPKYREYSDWPVFFESIKKSIDGCYYALKQNKFEDFRKGLVEITKSIEKLSGHLRAYVEQIFRKARINKGSRIYEHGISFGQTAEILGITPWELAEYIGQTGIANVPLTITKPIFERIKIARELFE
ncbi:MAG: hypothetical protein QXE64_02510 [Candidatus Pacearchaeota archaeon]